MNRAISRPALCAALLIAAALPSAAQGPGGRGGGPGGPQRGGGPPGSEPDVELVDLHDADGNGWLNAAERAKARETLAERQADAPRRRRRGGFRGGEPEVAEPGPKIAVKDAATYGDAGLYDTDTFRTLFLEFESDGWEAELAAFKTTDVEVPATLTVDGKTYPGVGVSFRGASSYFMVPEGFKRSFNLSMDLVDENQRLLGIKSINLLNGNGDDSLMSSVLYSGIARQYLPAPRANFVRVVVNGEFWGVFSNVEQFNKDFLKENFGSSKGTRWKVSGSPRGDGGLRYLGDDVEPYRERFAIKSKDNEDAWTALIELCRVLNETPAEELEAALEPILDVDTLLWFIAIDVALVNSDGYWVRASDYSLYLDGKGKFHVVPHDMNEALREGHGGGGPGGGRRGGGFGRRQRGEGGPPGGGPPGDGPPGDGPPGGGPGGERPGAGAQRGGGGGGGSQGAELDPLVGLDDASKPLRSKILAVPSFRARYLHHMRTLAEHDLSWETMGPKVARYREMISSAVEVDTKKRTTLEAFMSATAPEDEGTLRSFAKKRRDFLLSNEAVVPPASTNRRGLVINELMARNTSSFMDENGAFSDWIELHNASDAEMSLSGLSLSDDNADLHKWTFPGDAKIAAGGYLVILASGKKAAEAASAGGSLRANFRLSKSGESIFLTGVDAAGAPIVLDSIHFDDQGKDEAEGRDPENAYHWVRLTPTPGAPNRPLQ